jgi:hypothetical protein
VAKLRELVGSYYGAAMQGMSYPAYFNYLNTGGKITARSLMDTQALILTFLEDQEAKNEQIEQNFKDIREVLEKLVDKKVDNKVDKAVTDIDLTDYKVEDPAMHTATPDKPLDIEEYAKDPTFSCPECGKEAKTKAGLLAHQRGAHKSK